MHLFKHKRNGLWLEIQPQAISRSRQIDLENQYEMNDCRCNLDHVKIIINTC